jgi:alpha/beta superfamily hydrolase
MVMEMIRDIPGPVGPLEARLELPDGTPRAVAVFAHPHPQ